MSSKFVKLALIGSAAIIGVSSLLYYYQNDMIYIPNYPSREYRSPDNNPDGYKTPSERNIPYKDIHLKTSDGETLHCWLMLQESRDVPTILFFHANAGNMGMRMDVIEQFYKEIGVNVFIISYRGYGKSTGKPSEKGLQSDAEAAVSYLFNEDLILNKKKIFIYGSSLGGAVAIFTAWKFQGLPFGGLILENTFTSLPKLVDKLMPAISWLKWLVLANYWPSLNRIQEIKIPVLFISGVRDELIPHGHMIELKQAARQAKFTDWKLVKDGEHNTTWWKAGHNYPVWIREFINRSIN
ncbi:bem46_1 [Blepharisma stoltei]|uniref:AB hydrolase-1 domain-containing protein n=1 Tax=Blepharisma stoltei TaxID=1481888 RepID=A0AAU9K5B6_9CILI|nr:unnamed protein product [Blepharisma stoltei]